MRRNLLILVLFFLPLVAGAQVSISNAGGITFAGGSTKISMDTITFIGEAGDVVDATTGNIFTGTIGADDTLSITNMTDGQTLLVQITNGGTHALLWSGVSMPTGATTTLNSGANKRTIYTFVKIGGIISMSAPVYYE